MSSPLVSVIIPAYNQGNYIAQAVESALAQTYSNFEVIVVNDASTDHTNEVMCQFRDPRVKYIEHKQNRYAAAARNTGIRASSGHLIAFLDADDLAHPEKLEIQATFLAKNPDVGLTYSSRLEIDNSGQPLSFVQAPPIVTAADLVLGYPFAPSEVVMRRDRAYEIGLFDERFRCNAEDPDFFMRLSLSGCRMERTDRILNSRRLYPGRVLRNLTGVIREQSGAFENAFANPNCPPQVLALRESALAQLYLILAYDAFAQNETEIGQGLVREAMELDLMVLKDQTREFPRHLAMTSIRDGGEHEALLRGILAQFPAEVAWITDYTEWAVAYGYLARGARDILWGRTIRGAEHFDRAIQLGAKLDRTFCHYLIAQLLNYDAEFGHKVTQSVLDDLVPWLERAGDRGEVRRLLGSFSFNRALEGFRRGQYTRVIPNALRAIQRNPQYITNRGVWSIMVRSTLRRGLN